MQRIIINLLPPEIIASRKKGKRDVIFSKISIGVLILTVVVSILVVGFSVWQNFQYSENSKALSEMISKVETLKAQEGLIVVLKQRITDITKLLTTPKPASEAFILLSKLAPADIKFLSLTVDDKGAASLTGQTSNVSALQDFFDTLLDPAKNDQKISSVVLEGLSKGANNTINFELKIKFI